MGGCPGFTGRELFSSGQRGARERGAKHLSWRIAVVSHCVVLSQQVVPHGNRVGSPLQTYLVFRNRGLRGQIVHQMMSLRHEVLAAADVLEVEEIREMGCERRVDEQNLFARLRMGEHNRVLSPGFFAAIA